jgi:HEAT repeat protein
MEGGKVKNIKGGVSKMKLVRDAFVAVSIFVMLSVVKAGALFIFYDEPATPVQLTPGSVESGEVDSQDDFIPPAIGEENVIEESNPDVSWLPWITSGPQEAVNFVTHGLSAGETEVQRQAVGNKIQELIPDLNEVLSQSAQIQFRMGFGNDGSFLMEYQFVDAEGKTLADVVFKNSAITPPPGVLHAWKRSETSLKLYNPNTGDISKEVSITRSEDGSNTLVIEDKQENKKYLVKTDGTIEVEGEQGEHDVDEWLQALNDSDPENQTTAAINLSSWLKDNSSAEKASQVKEALIENIPAILNNEKLNEDKKSQIIACLIDNHPGLGVLSEIENNADESLKEKINDLMGKVLKDYLAESDFPEPSPDVFDPIDPRVVCINHLLTTDYGREILKEIARSDDEVVVDNFTHFIDKILVATLNFKPEEISQHRVDALVEILICYDKGKEKLGEDIGNYAEQGARVQLQAVLNSVNKIMGEETGKEFLDGIECSQKAKDLIEQIWKEITTPGEEIDKIIENLNDSSLTVEERIEAAKKLAEIGNDKAIDALLAVWENYHRQFQDNMVKVPVKDADSDLIKLGDAITEILTSLGDKIIPYLYQLYQESDKPFWTYMGILDIAHRVGSENALSLLKKAFLIEKYEGTSNDWALKDKARNYLIEADPAEAKTFFTGILSRPESYSELTRKFAVKGLVQIGDNESQTVLVNVLQNDPSESVRAESARGLAELGNTSSVQPILEQFLSPNPVYRKELKDALKLLVEKIESPDLKELTSNIVELHDAVEGKDREGVNSALEKIAQTGDLRAIVPLVRLLTDYQKEYADRTKEVIKELVAASGETGLQELQKINARLDERDDLKPVVEELIKELSPHQPQPPQPPQGPVTPERIYQEFGVEVVAGDEVAINYMYTSLEENYNLHRPQNFDPGSIMYPGGVIPQEDLESLYRVLKLLPPEFAQALKGKRIKLFSNILPVAEGGGVGGATYVEEPQIEKDNIYIFFSKAIESGYKDSFEEALIHEFMHVIYQTGLTEQDRATISQNFWHGERDIKRVLSNLNDFADKRIDFYKDKPNPIEIIMEDWAYLSASYVVDSQALVEKALVNTNAGLSTPITLPDGSRSSVLKEKVKFFATLLSHEVNGQVMTYIFKVRDGKFLRAEVPLGDDGLPVLNGDVKWEEIR